MQAPHLRPSPHFPSLCSRLRIPQAFRAAITVARVSVPVRVAVRERGIESDGARRNVFFGRNTSERKSERSARSPLHTHSRRSRRATAVAAAAAVSFLSFRSPHFSFSVCLIDVFEERRRHGREEGGG